MNWPPGLFSSRQQSQKSIRMKQLVDELAYVADWTILRWLGQKIDEMLWENLKFLTIQVTFVWSGCNEFVVMNVEFQKRLLT